MQSTALSFPDLGQLAETPRYRGDRFSNVVSQVLLEEPLANCWSGQSPDRGSKRHKLRTTGDQYQQH